MAGSHARAGGQHPALPDAVFFTVDPSSLLTTSHFQEGFGDIPPEWLAREFEAPDFNSMTEVLRSRSGVGTLHDATDGQPQRAAKYHEEMQPFGCEQELAFALRSARGESWGAVSLYREQGRPLFSTKTCVWRPRRRRPWRGWLA